MLENDPVLHLALRRLSENVGSLFLLPILLRAVKEGCVFRKFDSKFNRLVD